MKNLKKMIATLGLAVVMMMTVSTANAKSGMLISDLTGSDTQPCTEQKEGNTDWGILLADFTGVVVHGFTGIIIVGAADTPVDCGVVVHG